MTLRLSLVLLCAMLFLGTPGPVSAQDSQENPTEQLARELARLNRSLDRIVGLMEDSASYDRVELVLRRIDLKERRLAPLEAQMRRVDTQIFDHKSEIKRMEQMVEEHEDLLDDEIRDGTDRPGSDTRQYMHQLPQAVASITARYEELQLRQRRLEDELGDGRDEIALLDEALREMLE